MDSIDNDPTGAEPTENDGPSDRGRGGLSRRAFLRRGTLTAAAVGVVSAVPGLPSLLAGGASEAPAVGNGISEAEGDAGALTEPLLAHVTDLSTGEITLFQGEREIVVRNLSLARQFLSAAHP